MEAKLENYLYKKYPILFGDHTKPMTETCMCWGIQINDGWLCLLDNLCSRITHHIKSHNDNVDRYDKWDAEEGTHDRPDWAKTKITEVVFSQVKEKFGQLRIYYTGGDEVIRNMIDYVEAQSGLICEDCGKFDLTVGSTTKGWIHTICEECISKTRNGKKSGGWSLFETNRDAAKVFKQAMKDKEKNKKLVMDLAVKKLKRIKELSKKKV